MPIDEYEYESVLAMQLKLRDLENELSEERSKYENAMEVIKALERQISELKQFAMERD